MLNFGEIHFTHQFLYSNFLKSEQEKSKLKTKKQEKKKPHEQPKTTR